MCLASHGLGAVISTAQWDARPIPREGIFPSWRRPKGRSRRKNGSMQPPYFGGRRPGGTPWPSWVRNEAKFCRRFEVARVRQHAIGPTVATGFSVIFKTCGHYKDQTRRNIF
jgi:hypothetical protein